MNVFPSMRRRFPFDLKLVFSVFIALILLACTTNNNIGRQEAASSEQGTIPARATEFNGNTAILQIEIPVLDAKNKELTRRLAQDVIDTACLLEGESAEVNGIPVKVLHFADNRVVVEVPETTPSWPIGEKLVVRPLKKTIAIKDFEVIQSRDSAIARYAQEEVTTALVNSGRFSVVERSKLQSLLEEIQLGQTGLVNPERAQTVGKLIGADLILTGTLTKTEENWTANFRLVNTETGIIVSAINQSGVLNKLQKEALRESGVISGSFDSKEADLAGWVVGKRLRGRLGNDGYRNVYLDPTCGANGSSGALAMDFRLGKKRIVADKAILADLTNLMKRDLTRYRGIEFYIKGAKNLTVVFSLRDKADDQLHDEEWFRMIAVTKNWEKFSIDFKTLSLNKTRAKKLHSDQVLDLQKIESINWMVVEKHNPRGTESTIWIDEVAIY